jgi:hypothetical protein
MTEHSRYPIGLVWRRDGHVSDWVLSALVDGEDSALPQDATVHADSCEECAARLGTMASAAFSLGDALASWAEERARHEAPFPRTAFGAVGVLIAFVVIGLGVARGQEWMNLPHRVLTLWRWGRALAPWALERIGPLPMALGTLSVVMVAAAGLAVAARASLSSKQGSLS